MKNNIIKKDMKKTLWILACALCSQFTFAQAPKWAEKARKAVFSIVTYDKDNNVSTEIGKIGINYDLSDHQGVYTRFREVMG